MNRILSVFFSVLAVPFFASHASAASRAVVGVAVVDGIFLQSPYGIDDPEQIARWIMVSDSGRSCAYLHASWLNSYRDPSGFEIEGSDSHPGYYLARWGLVYSRERTATTWTVLGQGTWLDSSLTWTTVVGLPEGESATRHLIWQGERSTFFNDPRVEEGLKPRWYRVGADDTCTVFEETIHTYGPFGIETVELDSGLADAPLWTLTDGRSTTATNVEIGNWRP